MKIENLKERIQMFWSKYDAPVLFLVVITTLILLLLKINKDPVEDAVTQKSENMVDEYFKTLDDTQRITQLQDSIKKLTHENITLQEELALRATDNYELRARIWAINEYIRTGRFPADSTIRRKFTVHHGLPTKIRVR